MVSRIRYFLVLLSLTICLLLAWKSEAAGLDVSDLSLNYKHFEGPAYAPYFVLPPKETLTLTLNTDIFKYFFINNHIHGTTDGDQFRMIGWNYIVGARPLPFLDIQYEHHSQHLLDRDFPGHFPLENSIGFTLYFLTPDKRQSIIK